MTPSLYALHLSGITGPAKWVVIRRHHPRGDVFDAAGGPFLTEAEARSWIEAQS